MSDTLTSLNGRFFVAMQGDGNLVIYDAASMTPIWASNSMQPEPPTPPTPEPPTPPVPPPTPPPPQGEIRIINGTMHDQRGPFNPIGESLFWALWGYKYDRDRFLKNAQYLAVSQAVDYVRIFAQVGDGNPDDTHWSDRYIDPRWPDYDAVFTDTLAALHALGLRTQVTIFAGAGAPGVATIDERQTFADRIVRLCNAQKTRIMCLEIANEAVGFNDPQEMRDLCQRVKAQTTIPVAITSAFHDDGIYANTQGYADYATVHYDRDVSKGDGYDRPTRQPWGWPGEYTGDEKPAQAIDNEGIGPYSSVAEDKDPLRNVTRRAVAWIAGNLASLHHAGPGIYGGGRGAAQDGSPANFWDVPGMAPTLTGFGHIKRLIPPGISGWSRSNNLWASYPFAMVTPVGEDAIASGTGCVRAYATERDGQIVCLPFGIRSHVEMLPRGPMIWTVYNLLTGEPIDTGDSERIVLTDNPPAQLILAKRR